MNWKILALVAGCLITLVLISNALEKYNLVNVSFKIVNNNSLSPNIIYINKTYYNAKYAIFIYNQSKLNIDVISNYLDFLSNLPTPAYYYINISVYVTPLNVTLSNFTWLAVYKLDFKTFGNGTYGALLLHIVDENLWMHKYLTLHYNGSWLNSSITPSIFNVTLNVSKNEYKVWIIWGECGLSGKYSATFPAIKINNIIGYLVILQNGSVSNTAYINVNINKT